MIPFLLIAEAYDVEYHELTPDSSPVEDGIGKAIEWPVIPRVGEWFDLTSDGVVGRVESIWHFRDENGNPEIRVCCYVNIPDYQTLQRKGWMEV